MLLQDKIVEILNANDWEALEEFMFNNDVSFVDGEGDVDWEFFETSSGELLGFCNYSYNKENPDWHAVEDPSEFVSDEYNKTSSANIESIILGEIDRLKEVLDRLA